MSGTMKRGLFQVYLTTLLIVTIAAGGLMWLNTRPVEVKRETGPMQTPSGEKIPHGVFTTYFRGWPRNYATDSVLSAEDTGVVYKKWTQINGFTQLECALVALAILGVIGIGVEVCIRIFPTR